MCARAVQETLFRDHNRRMTLHAWCVMPNHVHVLLTPSESVALGALMSALKAASAAKVNKLLSRAGTQLWQVDYFDRAIRDGDHFAGAWEYIEWNPVKAKLVQDPVLFQWSSANEDARARLERVSTHQTP